MSDEIYKACKATEPKDLRDRIMNHNISKSEAEWWANARIAALEEVVGYLLPKAEYSNDGHCPECDVYHKEHLGGCHFIKIRAVLEGK